MLTERNACDSKECLINSYVARMESLSLEMEGIYELASGQVFSRSPNSYMHSEMLQIFGGRIICGPVTCKKYTIISN